VADTLVTDFALGSVTSEVIGAAIAVHRALGPGLLESAYEACLAYELSQRCTSFELQVPVPIQYGNVRLDCGYRIDMLVSARIVVELKAVDKLTKVHEAQLLTYMRLLNAPVGLLINFNVKMLKDGIVRRVLTRTPLSALGDLSGSMLEGETQ
jgi:GxxExxY protein